MYTARSNRRRSAEDRPRCVLLALAVCVLSLAAAAAAAQQTSDLTLVGTDGRPLTVVEIDLSAGDTSGSVQLFLRQDTGTVARQVVLSAVLAKGTPVFSPATLVVPPAPRQVAVAISVSGVTPGGVFGGVLVASGDDGATTISRIVVRKTSTLSIQGTGAEGIRLTHPVPELTRAFTVVSNAATPVTDVTLAVDDFLSPASVAAPTTVTVGGRPYAGEAFTVAAGGSYRFTVSASLAGTGAHTSRITLKRGSERFETRLTVTRTNVPPTVTVDPFDQLEVARRFGGGATEAPFRVALRETGGRVQILAAPELVSLVRKDGVRLPSTPGRLEIDGAGPGAEVWLAPYEPRVLEARLTGLEKAGEFTATIRLSDGTNSVIDRKLTVFVRDSAGWAFVAILIGVLVSSGLHLWLTARRGKLEDRYEAVLIEEEIRSFADWLPAPPPAGARPLIEGLLAYVEQVYQLTSSPIGPDTDTKLTDLREKTRLLRRWLRAAVRAEALGVRRKHRATFESVRRLLEARGSQPAERTQAAADLAVLEKALDAERPLPLDEMERHIDAMLQQTAAGSREEQTLEGQKGKLGNARTAIESADSAAAETLVGEVRDFLGDLQLVKIRNLIAGTDPAPGLSAASWKALHNKLEPRITAAEKMTGEAKADEADRIMSSLLGQLIPGLQDRMRSKGDAIEAQDPQLAGDIHRAAERLDAANPGLADDAVGAAAEVYRRVLREYVERLGPRLVEHGQQMSGRREQAPLDVPDPLAAIRPGSAPDTDPLPPSKLPGRVKLGVQLRLETGLVWLALAVIAVVIGMNLLYVNDPDWGGWGDVVVAVLWGLGVHSVGNVRSNGVRGLREQFASAAGT